MPWQKVLYLLSLKPGDMVRLKTPISTNPTYVVTANYGLHVTAVASVEVSNPPEWEVFRPE
jgi:hypothetical protein